MDKQQCIEKTVKYENRKTKLTDKIILKKNPNSKNKILHQFP